MTVLLVVAASIAGWSLATVQATDRPAEVGGAAPTAKGARTIDPYFVSTITHGTHTVRTYALVGTSATMSFFSNLYSVYKPN